MLIFLQVRQAKKTYSSPDGYLRYRQSLGNSQEVTDLPKGHKDQLSSWKRIFLSIQKKRTRFRGQQVLSKGRTCTLPEMPGFRHVRELSSWHQVDTGWT